MIYFKKVKKIYKMKKKVIETYLYKCILHKSGGNLPADGSVLPPEAAGGQSRAGRRRLLARAQDP